MGEDVARGAWGEKRDAGKALSLGDQVALVRMAFYDQFNRRDDSYDSYDYWTECGEVYEDFLVAESRERYYRVEYQMAAEGITFTRRTWTTG
jgi:hypothetical protein